MVDQVIEEVRELVQAAGARRAVSLVTTREDVLRFSEMCEWHKRVVFHDKERRKAVDSILRRIDGTYFCYHFAPTRIECGWTGSQHSSPSQTQTEREDANDN